MKIGCKESQMDRIKLNNAQDVLDYFSSEEALNKEGFLTMIQEGTYSEVEITEENIKDNAAFIMSIWD